MGLSFNIQTSKCLAIPLMASVDATSHELRKDWMSAFIDVKDIVLTRCHVSALHAKLHIQFLQVGIPEISKVASKNTRMMRILIGFSLLAAILSAQAHHEKPIEISYKSNKQVVDAEIDKDKNGTQGILKVEGEKKISIASPTNELQVNKTGGFIVDFDVLNVGNKSKEHSYSFDVSESKAAELFDGGVDYSDSGWITQDASTAHTKDEGQYSGGQAANYVKYLRVGEEERPHVEETGNIGLGSFAEHIVDPEKLSSYTFVWASDTKEKKLDGDALSLRQGDWLNKERWVEFDDTRNNVKERAAGAVNKDVILDKGPFYIHAIDEAKISNAQYSLEDLKSLRALVLGTDAADLKLNILEMLDYVP